MHRIYGLMIIVTLAAGLLVGCEKSSEATRTNAVVDVVAVAKALGKDAAFQQQIEQAQANLNTQLQQIQTSLQEQVQKRTEEAGENPTEEVQQELAQMRTEANRRLQQAVGEAQQRIQGLQMELGNQFRDEVKPIAEKIARERGSEVVLMNAGGVLWYDSSVDITADVIERMRTLAPPATAAVTPAPTTPAIPATTTEPAAETVTAPTGQ